MRISKVRMALMVIVALSAWWINPPMAAADQQVNLLFVDSYPAAGDNPNCSKGECADIIADNAGILGIDPAQIQLIGKLDGISGGSTTDTIEGGVFPFSSTPVDGTWECDGAGCTLTIDFSALALDWQIVKIIAKDGNDIAIGDFLTEGLLQGPLDDVQSAFISTAEIQAWCADNPGFPGSCTFGKFSHIYVFGVNQQRQVPEPGTLMLLGLGIAGLGAVARRRLVR